MRLQAHALTLSRRGTKPRGARFIAAGALAMAGLAMTGLGGCAQKPIIQRVVPPNPFGNTKVSAVCNTGKVTTDASGVMQVAMSVRSDGGTCALAVQQPGGGNYTTFGVDPAPSHGQAFLYNYDGQTYVTYTPTMAYAGPDAFTAVLIEGEGKPRLRLHVQESVDATGVVLPRPPAVTAPPASPTPRRTTHATRHRARAHS